jgi:hypothetical protein
MSAAQRDLRGSRPNSAAIAAQIEGFDNDFLVSVIRQAAATAAATASHQHLLACGQGWHWQWTLPALSYQQKQQR